jgi:pimeloyl-[acyl-carrier protein] methyl ester esterase
MNLHINLYGQGEDVVLLHGWGMNSDVWHSTAQGLMQTYCVHSIDLPGYGRSQSVTPYTLSTLTHIISQQFPFPVHVIGWSLGGLIGMQWALSQPRAIKSLTLVASSPCFMQRAGWSCATPMAHLQQFATQLATDYRGLIRRFLALQVMGGEMALQQLRSLEENLLRQGEPNKQVLLDGLQILMNSDLRSEVAQISCPMLLQYGAKDRMTPLKVGEWLLSACPDAQLVVHPQAAHIPFLSHATDFLTAQYHFLQQI